jgi:hypothetical protein
MFGGVESLSKLALRSDRRRASRGERRAMDKQLRGELDFACTTRTRTRMRTQVTGAASSERSARPRGCGIAGAAPRTAAARRPAAPAAFVNNVDIATGISKGD